MDIKNDKARQAWMNDPRFSDAQRGAIANTGKSDDSAQILGLDKKWRPVVKATVGSPPKERVWAIARNGEPTEPEWEDKSYGRERKNIAEPWM